MYGKSGFSVSKCTLHYQEQEWNLGTMKLSRTNHLHITIYISIVKPTRCTIFWVYWISLYMFRTVFPAIIRSPRLYIQRQVYVIQVFSLLASGPEMELHDFHLGTASKQSTNLWNIYLTLYVQSRTPDDGRKDRPKRVVSYSINSKNCASSWFYYRNISRCTVPWTSNLQFTIACLMAPEKSSFWMELPTGVWKVHV